MINHVEILNIVLKDNRYSTIVSIDEMIEAANIFSEEGDNGRALFLVHAALEILNSKKTNVPSGCYKDYIYIYLHKGAYEKLMGFNDLASLSFAEAIKLANKHRDDYPGTESTKYSALCYHFLGGHHAALKHMSKAVHCYDLTTGLLESVLDKDFECYQMLESAYSVMCDLHNNLGNESVAAEYKQKALKCGSKLSKRGE